MNANPPIRRYVEGTMPAFHYSAGNDKIGKLLNVSTSPRDACHHNAPCREGSNCYAAHFRKSCLEAYAENTLIAKHDLGLFMECVFFILARRHKSDTGRRRRTYFRWHVAGDILNQKYLDGMVHIARLFPMVRFLCFTKMQNLDYSKVPANLSIIFSMWPGWGRKIPGQRHAWLWDEHHDPRIPKNAFLCPGMCQRCGICWNIHKAGRDVVFIDHPVKKSVDRQLRESFHKKYGDARADRYYPLGKVYAGKRPFVPIEWEPQ